MLKGAPVAGAPSYLPTIYPSIRLSAYQSTIASGITYFTGSTGFPFTHTS